MDVVEKTGSDMIQNIADIDTPIASGMPVYIKLHHHTMPMKSLSSSTNPA